MGEETKAEEDKVWQYHNNHVELCTLFSTISESIYLVFPLKAPCKQFIQIVHLLISSLHRPSFLY